MAKTRSSLALSQRPRHFIPALPPRKPRRKRRTVAMPEKKTTKKKNQTPRRQTAPQMQSSGPPASTSETVRRSSFSYPKRRFSPPESLGPKPQTARENVAENGAECRKDKVSIVRRSCRTPRKEAVTPVDQGFPERKCLPSERNYCSACSSLQTSDMRASTVEVADASSREDSSQQLEGWNHFNAWSSEQDAALQNAYFQVRPSSNFWFYVAKKVPGKTAKECFDRFYMAHPTPPATQTCSKKFSIESPVRTISFTSPMSSLKCKGRFGRGKQGILKAHQTVRRILRQKKVADESYEADVFSTVEGLNSKDSLLRDLWGCKTRTTSPSFAMKSEKTKGLITTPARFSIHASCKELVGISAPLKMQTPPRHFHCKQFSEPAYRSNLLSPEVLKAEHNPSRLDRFLDALHMRRMQKRKSSSLKPSSKSREHFIAETMNLQGVAAAREAILMDAKEILQLSLPPKGTDEERSISSDQSEEESSPVPQ